MNKAEEQYLYWWGWNKAKADMMAWCWPEKGVNFIQYLKHYCLSKLGSDDATGFIKGIDAYCASIIRLIENNVITDWPSFVTHMTGEKYDS